MEKIKFPETITNKEVLERTGTKSWCWRRMEKIKLPEKISNKEVLERTGTKTCVKNPTVLYIF